jgi:SAM-dependent methyltransferase
MLAGQQLRYVGGELDLFAHARNWKRYFRARIAPYIGRRVAEVGAGNGSTAEVLAVLPHQVWFAIEPDPILLSCIEDKCRILKLPKTVVPIPGPLSNLWSNGRLDTILYIDVLEHIADDAAELEIAADMLVPGGHIVVLAPAYQALYTPFDAAIGHYRRYTLNRLKRVAPKRMLFQRGFYLDSVGLIASIANLALLKQSTPTLSQIVLWDRMMVPCSQILDIVTGCTFGRSVIAVWRRDHTS